MIQQRLDDIDESNRVFKPRMTIECVQVLPMRMDVELVGIPDGLKRAEAETTRLRSRRVLDALDGLEHFASHFRKRTQSGK
jgi:hypothetical protein